MAPTVVRPILAVLGFGPQKMGEPSFYLFFLLKTKKSSFLQVWAGDTGGLHQKHLAPSEKEATSRTVRPSGCEALLFRQGVFRERVFEGSRFRLV